MIIVIQRLKDSQKKIGKCNPCLFFFFYWTLMKLRQPYFQLFHQLYACVYILFDTYVKASSIFLPTSNIVKIDERKKNLSVLIRDYKSETFL